MGRPLRQVRVLEIAEVVLHVAVAVELRRQVAFELAEDGFERLAQSVSEHVETAAVRHAQHDLLDAVLGRRLDQRVEHRDQRRGAFEREALLPDVLHVEELLEGIRRQHTLEDAPPLLDAEPRTIARRLHLAHQPIAQLLVGHVDELDPQRPAVGFAQRRDQLTQRAVEVAEERLRINRLIEVGLAEPELAGIEQRMILEIGAQRIDPGDQVPELAVSVDQPVDTARGPGRSRSSRRVLGQIEAGEEQRPVFGHRSRVGAVASVHVFDVARVRALDEVEAFRHGF